MTSALRPMHSTAVSPFSQIGSINPSVGSFPALGKDWAILQALLPTATAYPIKILQLEARMTRCSSPPSATAADWWGHIPSLSTMFGTACVMYKSVLVGESSSAEREVAKWDEIGNYFIPGNGRERAGNAKIGVWLRKSGQRQYQKDLKKPLVIISYLDLAWCNGSCPHDKFVFSNGIAETCFFFWFSVWIIVLSFNKRLDSAQKRLELEDRSTNIRPLHFDNHSTASVGFKIFSACLSTGHRMQFA